MSYTFAADFETVNNPNDCRVWSWGAVEVSPKLKIDSEIEKGLDMLSFKRWLFKSSKIVYFHNLKFDVTFILCELLATGWTYYKGDDTRNMPSRHFYGLVNDMGVVYKVILKYKRYTIEFRDSYKLLPYKLSKIGAFLDMDIQKGEIDYNKYRPINYQPTTEEWEYLRKDVVILALALQALKKENVKKLTMSSQTLHNYKKHLEQMKIDFDEWFPKLSTEEYDFILDSYVGGLVLVNENHKNKVLENVKVYDVNSMYPAKLTFERMPYGYGRWFTGEFSGNEKLYIVKLTCSFKLKKGQHPWVRIRNNYLYKANHCCKMSIGYVTLTMSSEDLKNFYKHYDVSIKEWHGGYAYQSTDKLFASYIDINNQKKVENDGNEMKRTLYKLYNNGLYGKFGMKKVMSLKEPYLGDNGELRWRIYKTEENDGVYLPVAIFTTAYARSELLTPMRELGNDFIYCDTDSIHCFSTPPHIEANTHHTELGKWDNEFNATVAKYLGAKLYYMDGYTSKGKHKIKITGAGMTDEIKEQITLDNFVIGGEPFQGARKSRNVKGGVCILNTTYQIFERGIR